MAGKFTASGSWRDPQLEKFYMKGVATTGKTLGTGSYGTVIEIKYQETICAAKRTHDALLEAGNEEIQEIVEKYQRECQLMSSLRHPNITHFLGLYFLESSTLPLLVMERLEMSIGDILECASDIPLLVKVSILTDTCSGLAYLHSRAPPVIHRDLTARNVLLTSSLSAKITDLGNSRIVDFRSGMLAQTLTRNPGTAVYMPPEAYYGSCRYGPPLDVFSFGHLCLYTLLTQVFPGELLPSTYPNPSNPDQLVARSEVERRQTYMSILETTCGRCHPVLPQLVRHCLHNISERRPSTKDLLTQLRAVKSEMEGVYGGSVVKSFNTASLLHVKEMKDKDKIIQQLKVSGKQVVADNKALLTILEQMESHGRHLQAMNRDKQIALDKLEEDNRVKQIALDKLEEENRGKQIALDKLEEENRNKQITLDKLEEENRGKQIALDKREEENRDKQITLDRLEEENRDKQIALDKLEEENIGKQIALDRLEEENRDKQIALDRLEEENRDKQIALDKLEEENRSKQIALDKLEEENRDKQIALDKLEEDNIGKQAALDKLEEENRDKQIALDKLEEENRDKQIALDRLEEENRDKQITLEKLDEENIDKQIALDRLEEENRDKQITLEKLDEENRDKQIALDRLEEENRDKQITLEKLDEENRDKQITLDRLEQDNRHKQIALERLEEDNRHKQTALDRLEEANRHKQIALDRLEEENRHKQTALDRLEEENRYKQIALDRLEEENRHKQTALERFESVNSWLHQYTEVETMQRTKLRKKISTNTKKGLIKFPMKLHWKCGPDMPVAMSGSIQSVEVDGTVYVGGGSTDKKSEDYLVMAYSTKSHQWHKLPPHNTRWFAMTTIHNQLVLLGGLARDDTVSSELSNWQPSCSQWTHQYPAMSTPRYVSSAASYKHWLVVAGGLGPHGYCVHVEVLDTDRKQWSKGPATPMPWQDMKSTTIGDTWYIMGGWDARIAVPEAYSVSLESLVSFSASDNSKVSWRTLSALKCTSACPFNIGGSLMAVWGEDTKNKKPSALIQLYVPITDTWVQETGTPHAISTCTCIVTAHTLHVMGGQDGKTRCSRMFISALY